MRLVYIKSLIKLVHAQLTGKYFWNYRLFRRAHKDVPLGGAFRIACNGSLAIVVQGPIVEDEYFTVETLRLYRRNFPAAILILSAWEVPESIQDLLQEIDVHIVQNEKPKNPGIANINMQIATSRSGIVLAKKMGAKYALKTRADQRIYHPGLESYLFNLLDFFPLIDKTTNQRQRLIGISLDTQKYRMYGVSDMFLYGQIDDMVDYWDIPFDDRSDTSREIINTKQTWREFAIWRVGSTYLCTEYLNKVGRHIKFSLADSFDVLSKYFVIIDQDDIKLYWHKYTMNSHRYSQFGLYDSEVSFMDWLMICNNSQQLLVDESILDQPISQVY